MCKAGLAKATDLQLRVLHEVFGYSMRELYLGALEGGPCRCPWRPAPPLPRLTPARYFDAPLLSSDIYERPLALAGPGHAESADAGASATLALEQMPLRDLLLGHNRNVLLLPSGQARPTTLATACQRVAGVALLRTGRETQTAAWTECASGPRGAPDEGKEHDDQDDSSSSWLRLFDVKAGRLARSLRLDRFPARRLHFSAAAGQRELYVTGHNSDRSRQLDTSGLLLVDTRDRVWTRLALPAVGAITACAPAPRRDHLVALGLDSGLALVQDRRKWAAEPKAALAALPYRHRGTQPSPWLDGQPRGPMGSPASVTAICWQPWDDELLQTLYLGYGSRDGRVALWDATFGRVRACTKTGAQVTGAACVLDPASGSKHGRRRRRDLQGHALGSLVTSCGFRVGAPPAASENDEASPPPVDALCVWRTRLETGDGSDPGARVLVCTQRVQQRVGRGTGIPRALFLEAGGPHVVVGLPTRQCLVALHVAPGHGTDGKVETLPI